MPGIREIYHRTKKVPDRPWDLYVCRPIAAVVVSAVQSTRVTPNQITLASLGVALGAAGILLGWPGPLGGVLGVVVLEAAYVLDCADGMLARLRGTASPAGHLLDFLMDEIKAFIYLGVIAVRLAEEHGDSRYLLLGIGGLVALASGIGITTFQRRPEVAPAGAPGAHPSARSKSALQRLVTWAERFFRIFIHYPSYIWIPAVIGRFEYFLFPYVAVNVLYALRSMAWVALRFGRRSDG